MKPIKTYLIIIFFSFFLIIHHYSYAQEKSIFELSNQILKDSSDENRLVLNADLIDIIESSLSADIDAIHPFDSTGLLFDLISDDQQIQLITWAVKFGDKWEYYGFIKTFNETKKKYMVWELIPTDFNKCINSKEKHSIDSWPAGVFYKMVETDYNKKKYYTLFGWLANKEQTSFKLLEVLTKSKNGKPYFGKTPYFSVDKEYSNRLLFAYSSQSSFQLDYGRYAYTERKWNKKKRKYEYETFTEYLLVFDRLIPLYPDLKNNPEFLVPAGDVVDAFVFEKGKWRIKRDIDARNLKLKKEKNLKPSPNLLPNE